MDVVEVTEVVEDGNLSQAWVSRVRHQLIGAAVDAYPDEACGVITFTGLVWTVRNFAKRWPADRVEFVMHPEDVLMVWPHAAAIWHSHPNGRLDPSEVDLHWHPRCGATGLALGMVIVTFDDVRVAVPW